ncbi:MAG TPA: hypothetical protein VM469_01185 [Pseudoxanthomonas sp.]|nr:hypothetical protein [Pseudoxanthomonas sp.]
MTRSSPVWLCVGFAIAVIGVGFKFWQLPADVATLPQALYGPGLAAVAVVALLLRAFGTGRFLKIWLVIALSVPLAVAIRWIVGVPAADAFGIAVTVGLILGVGAALAGTAVGSLFLLRSSRRPE